MIASAQGTQVMWGGRMIGRLTSVKAQQSAGGEFDCTGIASPVVGSGDNTRVVRQVNPTVIEPAVATLELLGGTQFSRGDIGRTANLVVFTPGGTLSGAAYLADFSADAVTGEKLKSTATFKFTGF